jgi:class 3 adenylate cyclase
LAAENVSNVTVVVAWLDGLELMMEQFDATEMQGRLAALFEQLAKTAVMHGVEPVHSIGESWFGVCGLSTPRLDHAARSVAFAEEATAAVLRLGRSWSQEVLLRFGISSGEVDVGLGVRNHAAYDLWGRTLAVARRIAVEAAAGEVRVSDSTFALLTSTEDFTPCKPLETPAWGTIASWMRPVLRRQTADVVE